MDFKAKRNRKSASNLCLLEMVEKLHPYTPTIWLPIQDVSNDNRHVNVEGANSCSPTLDKEVQATKDY